MPVKRTQRKRATKKRSAKKAKTAKTGARAIWSGEISFGSVNLPVKLYSAVKDKSIHFRLLDETKREPVKQHMVDAESGDEVPYKEARRAVQVGKNRLVILDEEELEELEPESSREIEVTRFVKPEVITHEWYDRPYYLGPNGDSDRYFALVEALRSEGKEGVARWVMRNKEYVGALRVEGDHLMMVTLRHAGEVIPASALPSPGGREVSKRELEMARQLVETMIEEFDPTAFRDEYRERVLELVDAKAKGKVLRMPKVKEKKADTSLAAALERSIAAGKKRRKSA
jgi:DNA end-binding protein Ku